MERIRDVGESQVCTSIIVAAELRYGAEKRGSSRLKAQVEAVLHRIEVMPLSSPAAAVYAILRTRLERAGQPIGSNDLLIAAHAVTLGFRIVTANEREFGRVEGLQCENWLRIPDYLIQQRALDLGDPR